MKENYTILLTACVNPGKMIYTSVVDKDIRVSHYLNALDYYLRNTIWPIVFVENTGVDISESFEKYIEGGRLEYLTFCGNDFDKNRGKGYGEAIILEYAVNHSAFLQKADFIVKITGRLKLLDIKRQISFHHLFIPHCDIQCVLDREKSFADSRFFIVTLDFLQDNFLKKKEMINDCKGCYLEHILFSSICCQRGYTFYPLFLRPVISGVSGTTGKLYWEGNHYKTKLSHLQKMLDFSIWYNSSHKENATWMTNIILRIMKKGVEACFFLMNILKK